VFGILGHLEVRRTDGTAVRIAGPARRQVLAALLCRPDSLITASALIEDLWGSAPPRSAANSLRSHIARLRADLGQGGVLVTEGDAYRLCVGADDVDARQFQTLVREGVRAADTATAIARYDAALALWRDEPYMEFGDAPFAVLERIRLGELRASARERRTDLVLALGAPDELIGELEQRVRVEPYRERGWEQLAIALYRAGRQGDALDACRRARRVLRDDLGVDPGPALQTLEARLLQQDPDLLVRTPQPLVVHPVTNRCPYLGLAGYTEQDAALFVGRERLTATLAGRLGDQSVVVVTGASGVGKSSLVRAGLVPALRAGALPGSAAWRIEIRTPGDDVLPDPSDHPDLLVLDQAEEMFAGLEPGDCAELLARLRRHVGHDEGRLVLVLRSDFYGRLADVAELEKAVVLVGAMRADELRRALVEPATAVGLRLEDELVETIMDDVAGQPEPLPLLSAAMVRTWQRRDGNLLTLNGYRRSGELAGAIEAAAEECYEHLAPMQQRAARHLLVRLATRTDAGWVRRPVSRAEWEHAEPDEQAALDALIAARLVLADGRRIEITHDALLVHWPRLRAWLDERALAAELLQHLDQAATEWRSAGRQKTDLYRGPRLSAATDWRTEHPEDLSPNEHEYLEASASAADEELRAARAGTRRLRRVVIALAVVLVLAVAGGIGALYERSSAQHQAHRAELAAVSADAGRLAALSANATDSATGSLLALAGYRLQDTPETRSALLAAVERTKSALWHVQFPQRVFGVATTPNGSRVVVATANDAMVVDPATHKQVAEFAFPSPGLVRRPNTALVGLTPDGREAVVSQDATRSDAGRVSVLQVRSGRPLRTLTSAAATDIRSAVMSSDGRWLVIQTTERTRGGAVVQVYDARDWSAPPRQFETEGGDVALAAGRTAVAIEHADGSVEVRSLPSMHVLGGLGPSAVKPSGDAALGVSPDGSRIARTNPTGATRVSLYNTRAPDSTRTALPVIPAGGAVSLTFSPDGAELAVGTFGGPLGVYRSSDGTQVDAFSGNGGQLFETAWAGESGPTALYSVGLDGRLVSWDVSTQPRLFRESGPDYWGMRAALQTNVSVHGSRSVVAFGRPAGAAPDVQWRLAVDLRTGRIHVWRSSVPEACCIQTSLSRDGRLALETVQQAPPRGTDIPGSRVALWDLRTGQALWRLHVPPTRQANPAGFVSAITPDGKRAYVELTSSQIGVYALPSGKRVRSLSVHWASDPGTVDAWPWAFDPAGRLLVYGAVANAPDNRLGLLDPAAGKLVAQTRLGDIGQMMSEAWSNDGRLLAVGTFTGTVFLFDANTLALRAKINAVSAGAVRSISFSPDDQTMVTTGEAGELDFWSVPDLASELHLTAGVARVYAWYDATGRLVGMAQDPTQPDVDDEAMYRWFVFRSDPDSLAAEACALAGGDMTRGQWRRYVGDQPYQRVCPTAH
jgi:DNA-binding SARP family transcriptional activator/WD40 repeat protein